jgi:hypothetical protein
MNKVHFKNSEWAGDASQVESMLSMDKALGSMPHSTKKKNKLN